MGLHEPGNAAEVRRLIEWELAVEFPEWLIPEQWRETSVRWGHLKRFLVPKNGRPASAGLHQDGLNTYWIIRPSKMCFGDTI
jgi:hypothetical protein